MKQGRARPTGRADAAMPGDSSAPLATCLMGREAPEDAPRPRQPEHVRRAGQQQRVRRTPGKTTLDPEQASVSLGGQQPQRALTTPE